MVPRHASGATLFTANVMVALQQWCVYAVVPVEVAAYGSSFPALLMLCNCLERLDL